MIRTFDDLIEALQEIDPEAAHYLLHEEPKNRAIYFSKNTTLDSCLVWSTTRQGHRYWSNLNEQLKTYTKPPPKDGLTPVQRKCKKLWNNSNWVKKNPLQAY